MDFDVTFKDKLQVGHEVKVSLETAMIILAVILMSAYAIRKIK